tara:strand:- start:224 stop:436 length:213 start_codon:yes stop_codon:yes gene_type:complete
MTNRFSMGRYPTIAEQVQLAKTHPNPQANHLMRKYLNSIKRKRRALKKEQNLKEIKKLAAQAGIDLREVM